MAYFALEKYYKFLCLNQSSRSKNLRKLMLLQINVVGCTALNNLTGSAYKVCIRFIRRREV